MTQPTGEAGGTANSGGGSGGTASAGGAPTLFTQDQVNHFNADAKRNAVTNYFKELGFDKPPTGDELTAAITAAGEYQKIKDGEKTEVERLTGELGTTRTEAAKVPDLEKQLLRARLAGDAGLKSRLWKYVEGDDEESIKQSIQETLADMGGGSNGDEGGEQPPPDPAKQTRQGTGALTPNPQQGTNTGGAGQQSATLTAGADAYRAKHKKE